MTLLVDHVADEPCERGTGWMFCRPRSEEVHDLVVCRCECTCLDQKHCGRRTT